MKTLRIISYAIWVMVIIAIVFYANRTHAMQVGVVSDIHAGSLKTRKAGTSIVYPSKAVSYFEKAVKEMKKKNVDVIIALGDNTQAGGKKYYKQLKAVENKYGIKVLWVKGNHDNYRDFKYVSNKTNYYADFGDTRIIVLDTNFANANGNGRITPEGLQIYEEASQTDKKVVVAMHHPPFNKATKTCDWNPEYDWVNSADFILSGHWHIERDCGDFKVFPALTEKKKLNYRMVEL